MHTSKLHYLFGIVIVTLCSGVIPIQSNAAPQDLQKITEPAKERLVLMPLRVEEEDRNLLSAMETALVEGLKLKYVVFSGEQVAQKARAIYFKINQATAVNMHCDEIRCLQNIGEAFQAELIAVATVTKRDGGYFLALSIQNIFDNQVVFSKTMTCEGCNAFKVVDKLKILSAVVASNTNDTTNEETQADRKLKAEQLKKEQREFEDKLRNADAAERKRLLDAKAADDKHLAELKAAANERRRNSQAQPTTFPTLEQAQPEINKLNEKIATIEGSYEKELADTRKQMKQRYSDKLDALDNEQRNEFESKDEFKAKQEKKRNELKTQRDAELARLNVSTVAETETAPFKARIKALTEHEYIVDSEGIEAELGSYDSDEHQFPVKLRSKNSTLKLKLNATIPLQGSEAKAFKQQWQTGLVRPEAKAKFNGDVIEVVLINDSNNSRLVDYEGSFMPKEAAVAAETNMWNSVDKNSKAALENYLSKHSKSRYFAEASTQLKLVNEGYVSQGGLIWMTGNSSEMTWSDANGYCSSTAINGQNGWRLPTEGELKALYDSGMYSQGWWLGSRYTWSSTLFDMRMVNSANHHEVFHKVVNLNDGGASIGNDGDRYFVKCVHLR